MNRVLFFSFTAMLNPTLLAATTVMLLLPQPKRLMLGYLLGAMLTSITLGLVIVFTLQGSGAVDTAQNSVNPAVDIALGVLLLVVALVLGTGRQERFVKRRHERTGTKADKQPPRWQRALGKGSARIAFAVGVVLTLPGASYLAALARIGKEDLSTGGIVLVIVAFNVIMLALLEIPLLGFALAPERTNELVARFSAWLRRRGGRIALIVAVVVGVALVARGAITLLT